MKHHVETLCRQHEELRVLSDEYERELRKSEPELPALAKCRWMLARLVSAHLAYKRTYLYGTLVRSGDALAAKLSDDLGSLGNLLAAHVRDWTPSAIIADWTGYGRSSIALMAVLRAHMDREESELYPLLLKARAA